jgi:hypothetical protein
MKNKTLNLFIGSGVRLWLTLVLVLCVIAPCARCQDEPKTDHIKKPICDVIHANDFSSYGLKYIVTYTDGTADFVQAVELNSHDSNSLDDQCAAFLKTMYSAMVDEAVAAHKAHLVELKRNHYFLDVKKLAKR